MNRTERLIYFVTVALISLPNEIVANAFKTEPLGSSKSPNAVPQPPFDVYLGLDVGTQGTKCLAYCPQESKVIALSSVSYGVDTTTVQGRAEQDPNLWLNAIETCFQHIRTKINPRCYNIAGIGVSGQQHGMVALDDTMKPVRPAKLWCDVEASAQTQLLKEQARAILGIDRTFLTPGFTAPKILWMKQVEPDLFERTRWFVLPHDFVVLKLASLETPITDAGDASGNGVFDSTTRSNIPALTNLIDPSLMDKLPRILSPSDIAGYLNKHYSELLGLPSDHQVPVSVGSGDNMCSALGVGCVLPGQAVMSLGTSGTLFGVSQTRAALNTPLAPFCDATGQHLPLACTMSCTGVLTQILQECCPVGWTHERACQELQESKNIIPIGCNGVTFLPFVGGERTPNWPQATGALLGLTTQSLSKETLGLLWYRACMEAVTFCLADTLQYFPDPTLDKLYVVGGGAKNPFWRQMIADIMQCQLVFPVQMESAALGAAFQAGAAAQGLDVRDYVSNQKIAMEPETVEPIAENVEAYKVAFDRYRILGKALFGKC